MAAACGGRRHGIAGQPFPRLESLAHVAGRWPDTETRDATPMRRLFAILLLCATLPLQAAAPYRDIRWEELIPKNRDPAKEFRWPLDLANMTDADPRAIAALQRMKELWEQAPTEPSMAGRKVRLPGFVIPLERKGEEVVEFLLVPYFGACIHTPPPPANQIIHAVSAKPRGKMRSMEAFWALPC